MNSMQLGTVIVDSLIQLGLKHLVLSPGSRNSALSLAADAAARDGRVTLHVRIDERVAGFLALGIAKATSEPVAVITTSGTAAANLAPAAHEARAAGVGLLLITADRPSELVGTGANQTTDQPGMFSPATLGVVRLSSQSGDASSWTAGVQRAATLATGLRTRQPGPVQLNVEFTPPLVGELPQITVEPALVAAAPSPKATMLGSDPRTVVLVGDATPTVGAKARHLAETHQLPLLAEPTSNARAGVCAIANYRRLLSSPLGTEISRVLVYGHPTLSRQVAALLARDDVTIVVVSDQARWFDLGHRAELVADDIALTGSTPQWLAVWRTADAQAVDETETVRAVGVQIAQEVLASCGADENLVVGSSMAIRYLDDAALTTHPPTCYANRGLAGIDGVLATATGIALGTERPTTVFLGDLTLQHDLGSLVQPPLEPTMPLRVVVLDDDGGAIFNRLEMAAPAYADSFERVFGTPQHLDWSTVGAAFGWSVSQHDGYEGLAARLGEPINGRELIVVRLSR